MTTRRERGAQPARSRIRSPPHSPAGGSHSPKGVTLISGIVSAAFPEPRVPRAVMHCAGATTRVSTSGALAGNASLRAWPPDWAASNQSGRRARAGQGGAMSEGGARTAAVAEVSGSGSAAAPAQPNRQGTEVAEGPGAGGDVVLEGRSGRAAEDPAPAQDGAVAQVGPSSAPPRASTLSWAPRWSRDPNR
ncbi:uncharacterized protein LOC144337307 [Macaca mulatta]